MGLISISVKVRWCNSNKVWYMSKGYEYSNLFEIFEIKVTDLPPRSEVRVDVECDYCEVEFDTTWRNFLTCVKANGEYHCKKCGINLTGKKNAKITRLQNSTSFERWCVENNNESLLEKWDSELNDILPSETLFSSAMKYYFKCPRGIHRSELKQISVLTRDTAGKIKCNQCNSFAQWGTDSVCENFLDVYWDWEKNNEIGINPYSIDYASNRKVWLKCIHKNYHDSYDMKCCSFIKGHRCSYCSNSKVQSKDSFGQYIINTLGMKFLDRIWSTKNKISYYEYHTKSGKDVWWKCLDGIHEDFKRNINGSNARSFRCPSCDFSTGEKEIECFLLKHGIYYKPQKKFDGLLGVGKGRLSYDFHLPDYNLLIEYQGEFHDGSGNYYMNINLNKQREHDRRKRNYAKVNNINLLEIWYYDYDKIETILSKELNLTEVAKNEAV